MSCLQTDFQNKYSQSNQNANNLLTNSQNIGGNPTEFTQVNGQTAFKVPISNYFVTNPVVMLRLSGSYIGVVIPLGKPKIISASSDCFNSGQSGTIKVNVQNVGNVDGSFYSSLINCPGMDIQSQSKISVKAGETSEMDIQVSSSGAQDISQSCVINVTDYNGGGSDTTSVNLCMKTAEICTPNQEFTDGNVIKKCSSDGKSVTILNTCQYGTKTNSDGTIVCATQGGSIGQSSNNGVTGAAIGILGKSSSIGIIILVVFLILIGGAVGFYFYRNKSKNVVSKEAPVQREVLSSGKHCTKCGNSLNANSRFCTKCGERLKR